MSTTFAQLGLPSKIIRALSERDIVEPFPSAITTEREHVESIIEFASGWDREAPMLVHCWAGVSRSTAAALTVATVHNPGKEKDLTQRLRDAAPHANPNMRIVRLADDLLGCGGRLVEGVNAMGLGDFVERGPLVELEIFADEPLG